MKILLSAYACDPSKGAESQNGWNWAVELARAGHEVTCLTTDWGKAAIESQLARVPVPGLEMVFVAVPSWVARSYVNQVGVLLHYLYWQKEALAAAQRPERNFNSFDLVHHVTYASLQMGTSLWKLGKPLVFGPVGGGQQAPAGFGRFFGGEWHREVLRRWLGALLVHANPNTRHTISRAALVLASNQDTHRLARRLGASRVLTMLDSSVPDEFYPPAAPVRPPGPVLRLLWVGRLIGRKALPLALEALAQATDVPFTLTILGDGPQRKQLPQWLKHYQLEDRVTWCGQVPWSEVRQAYLTHDAFLFTSLRDSFGTQLLEAMACGLPLVTLDLHGASTLVPDEAGIKVPVTDPATTVRALADAVRLLHQQPKRRLAMGASGYAYARAQTWEHKVAAATAAYQQIVGSGVPVA